MTDNIKLGTLCIELNNKWHKATSIEISVWEEFLKKRLQNWNDDIQSLYKPGIYFNHNGLPYIIMDYMHQSTNSFENIYIQLNDGLFHEIKYIQEPSKPKTYQDLISKTKFQ